LVLLLILDNQFELEDHNY